MSSAVKEHAGEAWQKLVGTTTAVEDTVGKDTPPLEAGDVEQLPLFYLVRSPGRKARVWRKTMEMLANQRGVDALADTTSALYQAIMTIGSDWAALSRGVLGKYATKRVQQ